MAIACRKNPSFVWIATWRRQAQGTRNAAGVPAVPESRGATPYLVVKGAPEAIAFYERVFGATLVARLDAPDGSVRHAEMAVGPAQFMLTEERPDLGSLSPRTVGGSSTSVVVYVPDADATVERAVQAGATVTMPVANQFWGDRAGTVVDPFGHQWLVATHLEDPSPDEIRRRFEAMCENPSGAAAQGCAR